MNVIEKCRNLIFRYFPCFSATVIMIIIVIMLIQNEIRGKSDGNYYSSAASIDLRARMKRERKVGDEKEREDDNQFREFRIIFSSFCSSFFFKLLIIFFITDAASTNNRHSIEAKATRPLSDDRMTGRRWQRRKEKGENIENYFIFLRVDNNNCALPILSLDSYNTTLKRFFLKRGQKFF